MSFTDAEKTDIRRFCGYPAFGGVSSGFQNWRFFQAYGLLEYRLQNLSPSEESVVRQTYLANLYTLECAILGTSENLDTESAAVWKHNANEQRDREALYDSWRRKLCSFMGIPTGEGLGAGGITVVV